MFEAGLLCTADESDILNAELGDKVWRARARPMGFALTPGPLPLPVHLCVAPCVSVAVNSALVFFRHTIEPARVAESSAHAHFGLSLSPSPVSRAKSRLPLCGVLQSART